jgi:hypothetical protein
MNFDAAIEFLLNRLVRFMEEMGKGQHIGQEWEASNLMDAVSSFGERARPIVLLCKSRHPELEPTTSSIVSDIDVLEANVASDIANAKASANPARELVRLIADAEKIGDERSAFRLSVELLGLGRPALKEIVRDIENERATLHLRNLWALANMMISLPAESFVLSRQQNILWRLMLRRTDALCFYNVALKAKPLYPGGKAEQPPGYLMRVGRC